MFDGKVGFHGQGLSDRMVSPVVVDPTHEHAGGMLGHEGEKDIRVRLTEMQ